ncbi:MAG: hypothetical protein IPK60_06250 [Sandaracinaceae bacterium]|nr:hypothetical protein [Sandaracinaceae bacterium]
MSKPATKTPEVAVQSLRADVRGIATVEYVTLLVLVTLGGAAAVLALGVPFVKNVSVPTTFDCSALPVKVRSIFCLSEHS